MSGTPAVGTRFVLLAVLLPALLLAAVAVFPHALYVQVDVPTYLVLHSVLELGSIVVSFAIFAVNWHASKQRSDARSLLLGVAFLTVAILDTMHMLSYSGMPDFVTANSVAKAIVYWLGARLAQASAVLLAAFVAADARHLLLRRGSLLLAALAAAAAVFVATTYFWDALPAMYVVGEGLTPLKIALEYAVIAINLAAIAVYWRRARLASDAASFDLVPALIIVVFAELSFTLYASAYDTYNLIGHLLKVGAYYLLFRALFQTSVEHPYRELRRRHEQLAALSHTSLEVAASLDVDTVSGSVLGHCQQLTGAEMGFLGLSNGLGRLEVIAMRGIASGQCALRAQAVLFKEGTVLAAILLKGRPMRIADLSAEPGAVDVPPGHPPLRSLMGVPLLVKGSPVGLIALANKPGGFTAEDEGLVSALASQAAIAIENARLYAAERRLAELERSKVQELYQINRALNSSLGLSETLHAVVRSARELLKAEAAVALLVEADQSALRLAASAGTPAQANERAVPIAGTLAATVLASGKPLVGTDPAQWREASLLGLGAERRGTVLAAPLAVRGKLAGVLETYRRQDHAFTEEDVALLLSFADAAAVAVANAELYEQLRAEDEQLRELNRLKDEFISLASHELKSPLSSILGYAQLMLRKAKPDVGEDPAIKAWQAIVRQAERINSLVNQLLDVSRIQTGRLELNCQPTDLAALARGVVEQLAVTTDRHRLELEVPAEPVAGSWDPALLEQVLTNLVSNAIKYSPDGGLVTVRVFATSDIASLPGAGCLAGGPQWAVVAVADEGIGIPKEGLAQLFQRFYRAPNAARLRINGLGLGLYISQEIIALHGGRMWVVSEEGRGSEFLFCLPLA